jgi:uncharacterized membrane protein YbhN (UPF0104 family)
MPMLRKRVLRVLKVLVSVALLGWVLRSAVSREGADVLASRLASLALWPLGLAVLLHLLSVTFGVLRWDGLLRERGLALRASFLARSYLVGRFAAAFTPSTAGLDLVRALDVGRAVARPALSASVVAVEKAVGVLGLACVCAGLALFGGDVLPRGPSLLIAGLAALGALAGLAILARPARLAALLRVLPRRVLPGVRARATSVLDALPTGGLAPRTLLRAVLFGLAGHLCVSAVFVATGRALGVPASDVALLVVGNAIVVATLLPISISGVGVREGVAVVLLARVGVSATDATLIALLGYLTGQLPALLGGLLTLAPAPDARRSGPPRAPTENLPAPCPSG